MKDLFGNDIEVNNKSSEVALKEHDASTFQDRLSRLRYVNKVFPQVTLSFGSTESYYIFNEVKMAYVHGEYISTLVLAQSFIERRFQEFYRLRFDPKSKLTLSKILDHFRDTNFMDNYLVDKIDKLRLKRNPFVHLRDVLDKDAIFTRSGNNSYNIVKTLQEDAKESLTIMYIIAKLQIM